VVINNHKQFKILLNSEAIIAIKIPTKVSQPILKLAISISNKIEHPANAPVKSIHGDKKHTQ